MTDHVFSQHDCSKIDCQADNSAEIPPKREEGNEFVLAAEVISKQQKPIVTILDHMRRYSFSSEELMDYLTGESNSTTFF